MKYAVVFERAGQGYSAYVPDLPGCVATGRTRHQVERNIREAIEWHLEAMRNHNEPLPQPRAWTEVVDA